MVITREETFGPVAQLYRFKTDAEAIKMADDTEFGLAAFERDGCPPFLPVALVFMRPTHPSPRSLERCSPPNSRLRPSQLVEFNGAQRCLCDREELVELRRWHRRAAEHRVCLASMMDLVLEQVQQEA